MVSHSAHSGSLVNLSRSDATVSFAGRSWARLCGKPQSMHRRLMVRIAYTTTDTDHTPWLIQHHFSLPSRPSACLPACLHVQHRVHWRVGRQRRNVKQADMVNKAEADAEHLQTHVRAHDTWPEWSALHVLTSQCNALQLSLCVSCRTDLAACRQPPLVQQEQTVTGKCLLHPRKLRPGGFTVSRKHIRLTLFRLFFVLFFCRSYRCRCCCCCCCCGCAIQAGGR